MSPLALAISHALIHFIWQGSIVWFLLSLTLLVLRKKSVEARYVAGCAALAISAMLPVVTAWLMYAPSIAAPGSVGPGPNVFGINVAVDYVQQQPWAALLQSWILPTWSIGVVMFSLRLVLGYNYTLQLRRRAKPAGECVGAVVGRMASAMGIERKVRVLISETSDSPSVVGWLRPVILLPAATLMGLTPLQLEAILAHEIGHIRRHDYMVNTLQMIVETVLFYHPAVWWISKRIRLERELCCDDIAVCFSGSALRYARALTTLEKLRLRTPAVAMASTGGPLLYRIQRLVGVASTEYRPSRLPTMLAAGLGIACFALNVTWIRGQDAPGVKVDLGSAAVIHRSPVRYPEAAQKQGVTGIVQVEVKLDSAGNVADARVVTGPEELRKAALESVLSWHFTSEAARNTRVVTISFSTDGTRVQVVEPQVDQARARQAELEAAHRVLEENRGELTRGQELEREMAALTQKMTNTADLTSEQRAAAELKLSALRLEFDAVRTKNMLDTAHFLAHEGGRGNPVVGRTLTSISTPGLSESVRNDLISRLPVREGDILSSQTLEQTGMAVRDYDEHLRLQFVVTNDGRAELRVVAPGERR